MKIKQPTSRRDFLTLLGQMTALPLMQSPVQIMIESIVFGAFKTQQAMAQGITPRRYLQISHEGAPPRWGYDLFLTPYSGAFTAAKGIGTRISDTGKEVLYSTISKKGLNVPHMWQFNVPKAGGGTRPMDDLLANMICMRGINVANPAHGGAQAGQSVPMGSSLSTSALSGDPSTLPIPAVASNLNFFRYLSKASKSAVILPPTGNMLETLLNPFMRKDPNSPFSLKRESLDSALDASIQALNKAAEDLAPQGASVSKALDSAQQMLSQGFNDLDKTWDDLLSKYQDLIARAVSPSVSYSGINTKEVISDGTQAYVVDKTIVAKNTDLRTMITTKTACNRMASMFAMIEYVLLNNLSSSISVGMSPLSDLTVNGDKTFTASFDEHNTGSFASVILNTYYNLAFSACMLELIDKLKAKGIYQDTIIASGSEFGRSTKADGFGSDHGFSGGSSLLLGGALPQNPIVIGNIYLDKKQDIKDAGTWGYGAPVAGLEAPLSMGNWIASIAHLLRVPSPVPTATTVLIEQGGSVQPTIELAKQIA